MDVVPSRASPCNDTNTSRFVRSVAELERPDLVAYTGDVIDGSASPAPRRAMDELYGVAIGAGAYWGASLGNHEDQVRNFSRDAIYEYILGMPGNSLSQHGPVTDSPGNWYLDLIGSDEEAPVARLVFFDSRDDEVFRDGGHSVPNVALTPPSQYGRSTSRSTARS